MELFTYANEDYMELAPLHRLVRESLIAFPTEAHLHVLRHLELSGIGQDEADKFKQAWSKVVVGNESFGKKRDHGKNSKASADLFADELIKELFRDHVSCAKLTDHIKTLKSLTDDIANMPIKDVYDERQNIAINQAVEIAKDIVDQYNSSLASMYNLPKDYLAFTSDQDAYNIQLQIEFQDALDKIIIAWRKNELQESAYTPIDPMILFEHTYKSGKITFKSEKHSNIPPYLATDEVLGLCVSLDYSSGLEDAFETYGFLLEFLCCRFFNMFPKPLDVLYGDEPVMNNVFAFEKPNFERLTNFMSVELAQSLRRSPAVMHMWCTQLAVTARALHFSRGKLYTNLSLDHLHVTEEGALLLHSVGFEELHDDPPQPHHNFDVFTPFIIKILSTCLATSRTEKLSLPHVSSFRASGFALQNPETFDTIKSGRLEGAEDEEDDPQGYVTYCLAAGCRLDIDVFCGKVNRIVKHRYLDVYGPYPDEELKREEDYNILHVVEKIDGVAGQSHSSTSTGNNPNENKPPAITLLRPTLDEERQSATLVVEASCPCTIYFECSVVVPDFADYSRSTKRFG